jgi:hypothetical protein
MVFCRVRKDAALGFGRLATLSVPRQPKRAKMTSHSPSDARMPHSEVAPRALEALFAGRDSRQRARALIPGAICGDRRVCFLLLFALCFASDRTTRWTTPCVK